MPKGEFVHRLRRLHAEYVDRLVGQRSQQTGRQVVQRAAHPLGLFDIGLQGVVEHTGQGVAGDGAGSGFVLALPDQAGALRLPDADRQDAVRAQMDRRRQW